jgi:DNA-binding MurR/RpiR family transcriptional regulator
MSASVITAAKPIDVALATTVKARLLDPALVFTASERRIVGALLANYPSAGLGTVASLAARVPVSDPTVVRFVAKLGFGSFAAFQDALLGEVDKTLHSPLMMIEARRLDSPRGHLVPDYLREVAELVAVSASATAPAEYEAAVNLITSTKGRVLLHGGRFSRHLAAILEYMLRQIRPGIVLLDGNQSDLSDRLVDVNANDCAVIFDYRRYQTSVIQLAEKMRERKAKLIVFTDPWRSPAAALADVVFVSPVEATSPYDTMVPAMAQVEALCHAMIQRLGEAGRARIVELEKIRHSFGETIDADMDVSSHPKAGARS